MAYLNVHEVFERQQAAGPVAYQCWEELKRDLLVSTILTKVYRLNHVYAPTLAALPPERRTSGAISGTEAPVDNTISLSLTSVRVIKSNTYQNVFQNVYGGSFRYLQQQEWPLRAGLEQEQKQGELEVAFLLSFY